MEVMATGAGTPDKTRQTPAGGPRLGRRPELSAADVMRESRFQCDPMGRPSVENALRLKQRV